MDTLATGSHERLCEEYRGYVHGVINKNFYDYRYDEDLFQAAWIGLWEASKKYDEQRGVPFKNFAAVVIIRRCCDELKRRQRYNKFMAVSIYEEIPNTDLTYSDIIADQNDLMEDAIENIYIDELINAVQDSGLTPRQLKVMTYRLQGQTYKQVSADVGICENSVWVSMKAVREKFRTLL